KPVQKKLMQTERALVSILIQIVSAALDQFVHQVPPADLVSNLNAPLEAAPANFLVDILPEAADTQVECLPEEGPDGAVVVRASLFDSKAQSPVGRSRPR